MKRKREYVPYEELKKRIAKRRKPTPNLTNYLKRNLFSREKKYIDTFVNGSGWVIAGTGTLQCLNLVVQGVDENTRIGREISIKSILMRGYVNSATTTVGTGQIRTIIFVDSQSNGAAPAATDLLVSDALYGVNNLNNRKRFKILHDQIQDIGGIASSTGTPNSCHLNWFHKCNIPVEFNAVNGGTIADITKNSIFLLSYSIGLATTECIRQVVFRVRYTDNT